MTNSTRDRDRYSRLPRHPLVICAALVQNPANLGALCRTVEVFRLETLVLSDLAAVQAREFKKLAASAHHWQPLACCSPDRLPLWIEEYRSAGYGIIALHRSSEAIFLEKFTYPEKCVLVLGRELTGVPAKIVALCDRAVAISQFGMVESLNVQTAAAIAIYEYVRQHPLPE